MTTALSSTAPSTATTVSSSLTSNSNSSCINLNVNNKQWSNNSAPTISQPNLIPAHSASSISIPHSQSATQLSPAPPRPTPPLHSTFSAPNSAPIFAAPLPPALSRTSPMSSNSSVIPPQQPNPNPFSAESLFQSSKYQTSKSCLHIDKNSFENRFISDSTDMLRRELDNRFLATQDRGLGVAPPPYLRTEMHQHQHHHTHVHQHTTSLLPPSAAPTMYPSPLVSWN